MNKSTFALVPTLLILIAGASELTAQCAGGSCYRPSSSGSAYRALLPVLHAASPQTVRSVNAGSANRLAGSANAYDCRYYQRAPRAISQASNGSLSRTSYYTGGARPLPRPSFATSGSPIVRSTASVVPRCANGTCAFR